MTKLELDRAYLKGVEGRQIGKPRESNPYIHRRGRDGELMQERYYDGWDDQDARNRGLSHGND